jgi:integrase
LATALGVLAAAAARGPEALAEVVKALASAGKSVDDQGASSLPDNSIALDGGSSATKEDPMYRIIYGPYYKNGHHHVHLHLLDGTRKYKSFRTEEAAMDFIHRSEARIVNNPVTVAKAIELYLDSRADLKPSSRETIRYRLEALSDGFEDVLVQSFPAMTAWTHLVAKNAVDTLHGIRSAAVGFFEWCIRQPYLKKNPFTGIEIAGKKKRGKAQLRLDEARSFLERALVVASGERISKRRGSQQEVGVLGAATALLLGLRNGEVVGCQVRDLDDGGGTLWIAASKTEAGIRRVEIPDVLGPPLLKLAENRSGAEPLFPGLTKDGMRYWTRALCKKLELPQITPQGLRGTHATASMRPHANPHEVAAALGHESFAVTERHYARPAAVAAAKQQAAAEALAPSKNPSKTFGRGSKAA